MGRMQAHAVQVRGEGEPAMIFGHGIGGNQRQWDPLVAHFSRSHRTVTFALAGAADADPALFSPVRHSSVMGYADDLSLLVGQMGLRGAVYVGHPLSAMAGALAAAQWLAATLPRGQVRVLASIGHFPHVVDPPEVIAAIEAFGPETPR